MTQSLDNDTVKEVSTLELINHETEHYSFQEYVHVVIDNGVMSVYRSINDGYPNKRVKTTIKNVTFRRKGDKYTEREPSVFYLTDKQAKNFFNFLELLSKERTEVWLSVNYWQKNNSSMLEESDLNNESLIFAYETDSDRERYCEIDNTYRNIVQMMGSFGN